MTKTETHQPAQPAAHTPTVDLSDPLTAAKQIRAMMIELADLREALESIVALDDGDVPALWHYEKEFDAGRAALARARGAA